MADRSSQNQKDNRCKLYITGSALEFALEQVEPDGPLQDEFASGYSHLLFCPLAASSLAAPYGPRFSNHEPRQDLSLFL